MSKRSADDTLAASSENPIPQQKRKTQGVGQVDLNDVEDGPVVELHIGTSRRISAEAEGIQGIAAEPHPLPPLSLSPTLDDFFGVDLTGGQWLTSHDFLQHIFTGSRAVYVNCNGLGLTGKIERRRREERVSTLVKAMHNLNPEKILRDTSSDSIFVWLVDSQSQSSSSSLSSSKAPSSSSPHIRSVEIDNVDTALALYNAGHATYCRAPPEVEQNLVSSFLNSTGLGCGQYDPTDSNPLCLGRGEVETFLSKEGHTTSWHFDFQQNFTIQLSGTKRWTLQKGTILFPLRGCTPHYMDPSAVESQLKSHYLFDKRFMFGQPTVPTNAIGETQTVLLQPGDCLFFPAGMWHKIETLSDSVSINVSLMSMNYATLVSQAVQHHLYSDPRFRQPIINNSATNAIDQLRNMLVDLPQIMATLTSGNNSGAENILPPCLRFPPTFRRIDDDSDDDDDDDDGVVDNEHEHDGNSSNDGNGNGDSSVGSLDDNGDDVPTEESYEEDDEAIDPSEFVHYPEGWKFELELGSTVKLFKNPLSALHKRQELTDYYRKYKKRNPDIDRARETFVLNVNYGGNESQASAIRVAFLDNLENFAENLWKKERALPSPCTADTPLHVCSVTVNNHYLISFLVFHGYIRVEL